MQNVYCSREGIRFYGRGIKKKIWKSSMSQKTGKKQLKIQPEKATYIIKIRCFAKKDSVETV